MFSFRHWTPCSTGHSWPAGENFQDTSHGGGTHTWPGHLAEWSTADQGKDMAPRIHRPEYQNTKRELQVEKAWGWSLPDNGSVQICEETTQGTIKNEIE